MPDELDIYNYNELPFSADEGWAEMQVLLNRNLAVKKRPVAINLLLSSLPAMLLCALFLFSFLQLDTNVMPLQHRGIGLGTAPVNTPSLIPAEKNYATITTWSNNIAVDKNKNSNTKTGHENELQTGNDFNTEPISQLTQKISIENISRDISANKNRNSMIKTVLINNKPDFPMTIVPGKKEKLLQPWEFAAGIGVNMAAGTTQNLQPYPVAEIKYNLNPNVFVATGLSLFSPAPGNVSGVSKTVYVNDTTNNIRLYNEKVRYQHLRYADVPVFVGVNISKKVFLQVGLQASFLLNYKEEKKLQPYDFGMNSVDATINPLFGLAASPQEKFDVGLRNADYRFIAGIKYRQNKTTAGLFCQHGLQSAGMGSHTGKNSNQLFSLNILYQIK